MNTSHPNRTAQLSSFYRKTKAPAMFRKLPSYFAEKQCDWMS
jgi:hypothetical protein